MSTIDTISDLLTLSNSQFRLYDLGRKVTKLSKEQFNKVEHHQLPYPFPVQGHAIFAICFWQKEVTSPFFWFLKLPLDERGLINQGARNHFIAIIIEALGADLTTSPTERQEEILQANPYLYKPAEYKLAALNSLIKHELKQPASIHYEYFQSYMGGDIAWQDWRNIGIQGICDFSVRLTEPRNTELLVKNLKHLPNEVLYPLCIALENQSLNHQCIDAFIALNNSTNNPELLAHIIRALANSVKHPHALAFISEQVTENALDEDGFITVATKCWSIFENEQLLLAFLEQLTQMATLDLFNAIFKDLVAIPAIRPHVFACMRSNQRSDKLAKAIGLLFNQAK